LHTDRSRETIASRDKTGHRRRVRIVQLSQEQTPAGSLSRPPDLLAFPEAHERGEEFDRQAFEARRTWAVRAAA